MWKKLIIEPRNDETSNDNSLTLNKFPFRNVTTAGTSFCSINSIFRSFIFYYSTLFHQKTESFAATCVCSSEAQKSLENSTLAIAN